MEQPTKQHDISKEAVQGTMWNYASFVGGKGLIFFSTLILASLLVPRDYGLMGYCLIGIQYLDVLNNFGMNTALISRRDKIEQASNAAFVLSIVFSLILYAVAWFGAPAVATFFEEPQVIDLLRVLALVLPIGALGMVPSALIQRGLRFKAKIIPDLGRNFTKGICSIILAMLGFGVWSLVWGQLAGEIISTIALWMLVKWKPTYTFDRQVTREMVGFGSNIIFVGLLSALLNNIDYILVGKLLSAAALGYYTFAYRIPELLIRNSNVVIAKVAHPLLARLQTNAGELRSVYFGYARYISLFTFPIGVGLALIAEPFVTTFYPDRIQDGVLVSWQGAIFPMQCIAISIAILSVGHVPGVLYKSINRPGILTRISLFKTPIIVATIWYGTRWGTNGVAAVQILLALFAVTLDTIVVSRVIKFGAMELFRALTPAICGSIVMALSVGTLVLTVEPSGLVGLLLLVLVGMVAYISTLAFVSRDTVVQARTVLRSALART